ncbi:MAG: glycoside hydrolase family 9 protein [Limisphaerales bacterium]
MKQKISAVLSIVWLACTAVQTAWAIDDTWDYAVQVSAIVQASPPQIALSWPQDTSTLPNSYTVYRKAPGATSWGAGTALPGTATRYVDSNVSVGTAYEYQLVKSTANYTGYGYIYSGINVPLTESRGKVILIVDSTYATYVSAELARLQQDLVGDGWTVLRHDVARTATVPSVKSLIVGDYNADPSNVKAVFLFGHVPVPYSGNIVPDAHVPDHYGAWPADVYYADMTGTWTDNTVNNTSATDQRNWNVPGDGKFDQSSPPNPVQLEVGRVDFANLPGQTTWNGPATFPSEQDLLRQYLNKDHSFRAKLFNVPRRGLIYDGFGIRNGEAFAASGYRNFAPFFTPANITTLTNAGTWIPTLSTDSYLWAWGGGGGGYNGIAGIGTNGAYFTGYTPDIVSTDSKAVFVMLFGSWLGDWDSPDNIMRGILATPSYGLTCSWSGRPHWFYQHMGLGETIGYSARLTQNNNGLYQNQINSAAGYIHIALMGDPTLRMHPVAPPVGLTASATAGGVALNWGASADPVLGYYVYRAPNPAGPFTRVSGSLLTGTAFTDASVTSTTDTYLVRAVKLETTPSGSYYNASQGAFSNQGGSSTPPPTDTTPPTVTMTAPVSNATVVGAAVIIAATATDNVGVAGVQFTLDGANLGAEQTIAPYTLTWDTTVSSNGSHSLAAVARDAAGNQAAAVAVTALVSNVVSTSPAPVTISATGTYWVDDALPAGAVSAADGGDGWTWVGSNPAPFAGGLAHQSSLSAGLHEHYFYAATATLTVNTNDTVFAYVYLDPANPPSEVMLQWNDGSWEHRAYWGANNITYGIYGTVSRYYAGTLPALGQWVQLAVPAGQVGLGGSPVNGLAFSTYDGRATWDAAGSSSPVVANALPAVSVTASSATATIGTTNDGAFTFTRTGSSSTALTVNYTLGGTAVKWNDYRTPQGDMPVVVTIPAGAAATTLTIVGITNSMAANPETVVLSLSADPGYTLGSPTNATITILSSTTTTTTTTTSSTTSSVTTAPAATGSLASTSASSASIVDYTNLQLPKPGQNTLHVLTPTLLELVLVNTKDPNPATVSTWNLVDASYQFQAPALTALVVTADGQPVLVQGLGFKRRPLYAPLKNRDLRIANYLYLELASPIADGQTVQVLNPDATLWSTNLQFTATAAPLRFSPAIHVNQEGYVPGFPKKAVIGYYLGNLGEMSVPTTGGFQLIDANSGAVVYQGSLVLRQDSGYNYSPTPYQQVYEADFSTVTTAGAYRLAVPGLGASLPFRIDDGVAMAFARAYALGLYHQRCGTNNALPFTRFTHDPCHIAPAGVPAVAANFPFTWNTISNYALISNPDNPPQTAPLLTSPAAQLYPFVNTGTIDVSGGHHDAGDYSKYTANSASLVHTLMFAVDAFPGVAQLDNLGVPESGDGISDVLQEAKWEADFLAKMQDADGGFYFLVYPQNREYEQDVLPDHGDPQVVWPKTTSVTAASVAALAQCASSPLFKKTFPAAAASYLAQAKLGWQFLSNAIAKYGKAGAYQKITHYGDMFAHDDELAWAACEMYLATGDATYQQTLLSWFDPASPATWRWGWWHMFGCYGNAIRSYAFAVKSGRLSASQLDPVFLAKCQAEISAAANDAATWSQQNAYGTSFPTETKAVLSAGWYFSNDQAFDLTVAYQLDPQPAYLDAILKNLNYEGGCNPVNVTYVTGLGWKRQRETVGQYAQNDRRVLPPSGIPLGNIQGGFANTLYYYGTELNGLSFPQDNATTAPHPFYDRWGDSYNVTTEFVVLNQARSLGSLAYWAAQTTSAAQPWSAAAGQISVPTNTVPLGAPVTATFAVPGLDVSGARIVWEARDQEPAYGPSYTFAPVNNGTQWVEVEAQWPDGRRVFAATNFYANSPTVVWVEDTLPSGAVPGADGGDSWNWVGSSPTPFSGSLASQSSVGAGLHEHYFDNATATLVVGTGESMFAYVYLDPANPPTEVMLQWNDGAWEHRAYWGADNITYGAAGTAGRYYAGSLPTAGQWVRLEVPGSAVGLEGSTVKGMAFSLFDGRATWDHAGKSSQVVTFSQPVTSPPASPPTLVVTATDAQASRVGLDPGVFTFSRTGDTSADLTVNYWPGGTAINGLDYQTLPSSVTIPAGASSTTLTLTPLPSTNLVSQETAIVTLASSVLYVVGTPNSGTVNITGNSVPITSVKATGKGITVTWTSVPGKIYQAVYKTTVLDKAWTALGGSITATATTTSVTDTTATKSTQRYYAVYVEN